MSKHSNKAITTRLKIVRAAANLFFVYGYTATGLDRIIKEAGITKGNFYYYFKSKEVLAIEVLTWHFEQTSLQVQGILQQEETPLKTLFLVFDSIVAREQKQYDEGDICGCFYGNLTLEMSISSKDVRHKVHGIFTSYQQLFSQLLFKAKQQQEVLDTINCDETAELILSMVEGALILDKAKQQPTALPKAIKFLKTYLKS